MSLALGLLLASVNSPGLRLEREGQELYLVHGKDRHLLVGRIEQQTKLGRSLVRYGNEVIPSIEGKDGTLKFDLRAALIEWLKDDAKWGGHAQANELRYMDASGGGIGSSLTQFVAQTPTVGLGIVGLRFLGPSGEPVGAQALVRLDVTGRLDFLRSLTPSGNPAMYNRAPTLRIYRSRAGQTLLHEGQLWTLDATGTIGKAVGKIPEGTPVGLSDGRYLIVLHHVGGDDIDVFDLQRLRSFRVFKETETQYGKYTVLLHVPSEGGYLLMERQHGTEGRDAEHFTLHIPDGRRTPVPPTVQETWRGYAIGVDTDRVTVFNAATGRMIATLTIPPAKDLHAPGLD